MTDSGLVFDVRRYSIHDGPGIRTTVFFKGCPLSCWWCHNPESQSPQAEMVFRPERCIGCGVCLEVCPTGALSAQQGLEQARVVHDRARCTACGACARACYAEARERVGREVTVPALLAEIERDRPFFEQSGGGVTFSGGEPLLQPDFLLALLRACREREIHTALDTCGCAPWETLQRVRGYVDLFLYDLKLMDSARHRLYTGVPNDLLLQNLRRLSEAGQRIVLRVPLIPGINDDEENVRQIGAFAAALPYLDGVELLPYHPTGVDKYARLNRAYRLPGTRPPTDERMAEIKAVLERFGLPLNNRTALLTQGCKGQQTIRINPPNLCNPCNPWQKRRHHDR